MFFVLGMLLLSFADEGKKSGMNHTWDVFPSSAS
jgi:hypothetical protein